MKGKNQNLNQKTLRAMAESLRQLKTARKTRAKRRPTKTTKQKNRSKQSAHHRGAKRLFSTQNFNMVTNSTMKTRVTNKAGTGSSNGIDHLTTLKVYPPEDINGGIKLIYSKEISPSSFPKTRLEYLSNAYQMYKFNSMHFKYNPSTTTVVNGALIAYIDTDPVEQNMPTNRDDLLRLAKSHQYAVQSSISRSWTVKLPIRNDDQFFLRW